MCTDGFYGEHRGERVHVKQGDEYPANHPLVRARPERFAAADTLEQKAAARAAFESESESASEDDSAGEVEQPVDEDNES
jgi:hypothetical protein